MLKRMFITSLLTVFDLLLILSILTVIGILTHREPTLDHIFLVLITFTLGKVNYRSIR